MVRSISNVVQSGGGISDAQASAITTNTTATGNNAISITANTLSSTVNTTFRGINTPLVTMMNTAPIWKQLSNFDGVNRLGAFVSDLGGVWQISQASRIQRGTAYFVTLRGLVQRTGNFASSNYVATLPVGWRPAKNQAFVCVKHTSVNNDEVIRLDVETNGAIIIRTSAVYASLDGISFWTN
jgi:hypothetical protein